MKVDTSGAEDLYFVAPAKYLGDQRFAYTFTLSFKLQQDNGSLPAASSRGDVILEGKWFNKPLVTSLSTPPPAGNNFRKYEVRAHPCPMNINRYHYLSKHPCHSYYMYNYLSLLCYPLSL